MGKKEFKTYRQLLTILRNRGVSIKKGSVGSRTIKSLEKENYYNVINGYKKIFIDIPATSTSEEKYKAGSTFDEIHALYSFDRELRHIYLKYLLKIENNFKTVVAHLFSEKYGHDNYLKLENFYSIASMDKSTLNRIAKQKRLDINKDRAKIDCLSAEENVANVMVNWRYPARNCKAAQ